MDIINSAGAVTIIANGTSQYLVEFAPFFLFVMGLALAIAVISGIISAFLPHNGHNDDDTL